MQLLPKNISGRRANIIDSPSIEKHASGGGSSFRTKILKCVGRGRADKTTIQSGISSSSNCAHDMIKRTKMISSKEQSSTQSLERDFSTKSFMSLSDRTEDTELMMSSYSCNNNTIVYDDNDVHHEEPQVHVRRLSCTEEGDYECSSSSSYQGSASYVSESSDDSSWSSEEDEGEGYSSSDDDVSLSSMDSAELYESSNIQNMILSASTSSKRRLQRYDDCLVPTRAEQQAYIDHIKASVAQEVTPLSPSPPSSTDETVSDDYDQEEEVPICQECQEEISFPDICCRHHPNIHLKRFSPTKNKWLTLFNVCPICEAHDDFKQQYDRSRRSIPCPPKRNEEEEEEESMTLHFVRCRI